jgi:hypothetical protein
LTDRVETPERGICGDAAAQSAPQKAHTSKDFTWGLLAILALVGIGIVLTRAFRNSAQPVTTSSCPAGTTGAPRARLLGALSCAKQSGNGTLTFTEGGRSIVMTYQEPASLMTVESQPGAAGPGPIRVIQIGTDNWQSQGTGRWDHFIDDPKDFLDSLAAQVRQAATIDRTGSTFQRPPIGPRQRQLRGGRTARPDHVGGERDPGVVERNRQQRRLERGLPRCVFSDGVHTPDHGPPVRPGRRQQAWWGTVTAGSTGPTDPDGLHAGTPGR